MNTLKLKIKDYIQPFEKRLAFMELERVSSISNVDVNVDGFFSLATELKPEEIADKLAYWEYVLDSDTIFYTKQSRLEATTNITRNGISIDDIKISLPFKQDIPLPRRRCLRYASHGIHEYRGKFFPQLVRSLINISGIKDGATVADPMIGSGTTLVESLVSGKKCLAVDMNPLSVFIAKVKAQILTLAPDDLAYEYSALRNILLNEKDKKELNYFKTLDDCDQKYLSEWFSPDVLTSLDDIITRVMSVKEPIIKNLFIVCLSNIIRKVSWQKDADLRVRKDVRLDAEIDPKKEFLEELGRTVRSILSFLYEHGPLINIDYSVSENDARNCGNIWGRDSVDLVITSPPYATALPYLDTDRLSLYFLGLLSRPQHRRLDQNMIGNREINEKTRIKYIDNFHKNKDQLPQSVKDLILKIDSLNSKGTVGFRRKNLSALLAKYFFDMKSVLQGIHYCLKPGSSAYIVIGDNHTVAGGQRIEINTADLLEEIAALVGFLVEPCIPMEILISRDIHRNNAMISEKILFLRKSGYSV